MSEEDEARRAAANMSRQQKAELLLALEGFEKGEPLPDTPAGRVINTLSFHQREVVLQILREEHVNDPA